MPESSYRHTTSIPPPVFGEEIGPGQGENRVTASLLQPFGEISPGGAALGGGLQNGEGQIFPVNLHGFSTRHPGKNFLGAVL